MVIKPTAIPELDQAIDSHARALLAADRDAAGRFVAERARESWRDAIGAAESKRPLESYEILARAKIGFQYVAKVRWAGARGLVVLQIRWSQDGDAGWRIVEVEDLSLKRSPWSDIPPLSAVLPRSGNGNA
jgi:hypothetical protein